MSTITLPPTDGAAPQRPATSEVSAGFVEVMLHHCGFNPITIRGDAWEVPEEVGPFDATNAPAEWVGRGIIERAVDGASLHYMDESGITLEFVPDDGRDPLCD